MQNGNCPEGEKVVYGEVVSAWEGDSVKRGLFGKGRVGAQPLGGGRIGI